MKRNDFDSEVVKYFLKQKYISAIPKKKPEIVKELLSNIEFDVNAIVNDNVL